MNFSFFFKKFITYFQRDVRLCLVLGFISSLIIIQVDPVSAIEEITGKQLFIQNCAGCHINGGNIIRRGKTLKLKDLQKNGLDNPKAIAKIAREGIGSMSGYKELLGEGGDEIVGDWIWEQAQNAWTQG